MQFQLLALLGLTAIATAAPAAYAEAEPASLEIAARNGGSGYCCPRGSRNGCSPCSSRQQCPSNRPDRYTSCSKDNQIGVLNLFFCDVLNNDSVSIPVTINVL